MALSYLGNTDFIQSGPPQWNLSVWDLDTLTIPYQGGADGLSAFLAGLVKFSASVIDSDMFLIDWRVSGNNPAAPVVELIYTGKMGGVLPATKSSTTYQIQQISGNIIYNLLVGALPVNVTYVSPTNNLLSVTREQLIDFATIGDFEVAAVTVVNFFFNNGFIMGDPTLLALFTALQERGVEGGSIGLDDPAVVAWREAVIPIILCFFFERSITTGLSEEIIPGQYFRNTIAVQNLLMPVIN